MATDKLQTTVDQIQKVNGVLNIEQLRFLFAKTPARHIYQRPAKGGGTWDYVTGTYIKKVLNMMFGWNWSFEVDKFDLNMEAKQAIVLGRLTVISGDQRIVKMQFGRQDIKFRKDSTVPLDLGNDLKGATTDALKKCAAELGIASDIYGKKEFKEIELTESRPTDDQLAYFDELIEQCQLSDEEEQRIRFTLPTDTMRDMAAKIETLRDLLNDRSVVAQYEKRMKL